jgi:hypothetical protein
MVGSQKFYKPCLKTTEVSLSYARSVACFAGPHSVPPRSKPDAGRHPVKAIPKDIGIWVGGHAGPPLREFPRVCTEDATALPVGGCGPGWALASPRWSAGAGRCARLEAGEVSHRGGNAGEVAGIDRLRFERAEVGVDTCTPRPAYCGAGCRRCKCARAKRVIGRSWPADGVSQAASSSRMQPAVEPADHDLVFENLIQKSLENSIIL